MSQIVPRHVSYRRITLAVLLLDALAVFALVMGGFGTAPAYADDVNPPVVVDASAPAPAPSGDPASPTPTPTPDPTVTVTATPEPAPTVTATATVTAEPVAADSPMTADQGSAAVFLLGTLSLVSIASFVLAQSRPKGLPGA